ncbi:hypothetical protein FCV25MIE_24765 [Fagus crenata]
MDLEEEVLTSLQRVTLSADEETNIVITAEKRGNILQECSLSLFGKFLTIKSVNRRAAKDTMRLAWRLGPELRILEVGNDTFQFIFPSKGQMEWVLDNGPWSFENHLLVLRRWERGMSTRTMTFNTATFWIQIWGLPFDLMTEDVGKEVGNHIGCYVSSDKRKHPTDKARYMRVRVEVDIKNPLRRGGFVLSPEGERVGVFYRYERLPSFCCWCGKMGHDGRSCTAYTHGKGSQPPPFGAWLQAQLGGRRGFQQAQAGFGNKPESPVSPSDENSVPVDDASAEVVPHDGERVKRDSRGVKSNSPYNDGNSLMLFHLNKVNAHILEGALKGPFTCHSSLENPHHNGSFDSRVVTDIPNPDMHDFRHTASHCHASLLSSSQLSEGIGGGPLMDVVGVESDIPKQKSLATWKRFPEVVQSGRLDTITWLGAKRGASENEVSSPSSQEYNKKLKVSSGPLQPDDMLESVVAVVQPRRKQ